MILIKPIVIIFSFISFISCVGESITCIEGNGFSRNRVYLKVNNNTLENISYQLSTIHCSIGQNDNGTEIEGFFECDIHKGINTDYTDPKYWGTDIPSIEMATLKPSDNTTWYNDIGPSIRTHRDTYASFIATVTIGNVSKKIVGFNEKLYRKLYDNQPLEFFDDVISYGTFYGGMLSDVIPTDFEYNPCWVGANTALTEYAKFSINARYYFDISIKGINDIEVSLDKTKSRIGDSGYDIGTDTCKFYIDENILHSEEDLPSFFPFSDEDYDNIPEDLTGRIYIITEAGIGDKIIGYGSDPQ